MNFQIGREKFFLDYILKTLGLHMPKKFAFGKTDNLFWKSRYSTFIFIVASQSKQERVNNYIKILYHGWDSSLNYAGSLKWREALLYVLAT